MDPHPLRLAFLEPGNQAERSQRWCTNKEMVVGREQLEHTKQRAV